MKFFDLLSNQWWIILDILRNWIVRTANSIRAWIFFCNWRRIFNECCAWNKESWCAKIHSFIRYPSLEVIHFFFVKIGKDETNEIQQNEEFFKWFSRFPQKRNGISAKEIGILKPYKREADGGYPLGQVLRCFFWFYKISRLSLFYSNLLCINWLLNKKQKNQCFNAWEKGNWFLNYIFL